MFEKEAEEYAEINKPFLNRYDCVCVFKDGAEFGYNKAKEEMQAQIEKMKRCEICTHYYWESCNYHSNWVKKCKENGMELFELKEIKEND